MHNWGKSSPKKYYLLRNKGGRGTKTREKEKTTGRKILALFKKRAHL